MSIMAKTPSGYKKIGSAYLGERPVDKVFNANGDVVYALRRELTGVPPLLFKGKEQSELLNYRIYGDTVDGESVGDRTANLIQGSIKNANIGNNGKINTSNEFFLVYAPVATGESYTISNNDGTNVYAFYNAVPSTETATSYDSSRQVFSTSTITFVSPTTGYIAVRLANTAQDIMINPGSTALPYEPYGYKVPVTVTVKGKNLLQNTATSQTINGVTFTVNDDGSITCNGTAEQTIFLSINNFIRIDGNVILSGCPDGGGSDSYMLRINSSGTITTRDQGSGANAINPRGMVEIRIASGYTCNNVTFYPMIRKADIENDTYEPYHTPVTTPIYLPEPIKMVGDEAEYIDYAEQKMHRVRKNLLPNEATSQTRGRDESDPETYPGVTFTVNDDKSVTCNGASNQTTYIYLCMDFIPEEGITYLYSGCPQNGGIRSYELDLLNPSGIIKQDIGNGITFDSTSRDGYLRVRLRIGAGYTCNNLTFYPTIRKADIEDDTYEPYIENTDLDVTLPALPTIKGTNMMSVDTEVQPSRMDIKGRIKSLT